ncbi:MAG: hypothetical protein M4579_002015 [Chaenotheca gracillima]|nr:MAG: hypothetical protein M4579_002015 [Chaenotheca gracillima]
MYARGILFGKMKYELGDHSFVRCPEHNLVADIDFKTKGYFGGTYNAISGVIKNEKTQEIFYELSGSWNGEMFLKDHMTGHKELLFDASHSKPTPPEARPLEEQDERESQKLWLKAVTALKERNHEVATDEKTHIEDMQREEASKRAEDGVDWHPRFFRPVHGGPGGSEEGEEDLDWILNADIDDSDIELQKKQILSVAPILPGSHASQEFNIPAQSHHQPQSSQKRAEPAPVQPTNNHSGGGGDNLIDFDDAAPAAATTHAPHQAESQTRQESRAQPTEENMYAPAGLQQPLQPTSSNTKVSPMDNTTGPVLTRRDTNSGQEDEFVDAEDDTADAGVEPGVSAVPEQSGQRKFF